jgi:hypothetical protein
MAFGLSGWRPKHLLASWIAYWTAAAAMKLSPAIATAWRITGDDHHGTISAGFNDSKLHLTMIDAGQAVWQGTTEVGTLMLWIAGPPLLLWLVWLVTRRRPEARERPAAGITTIERPITRERPADARALGEGPAAGAAPGAPLRGRDTPAPRQYDDRRIR